LDPHQYSYTDVSATPGTWYYRLRQVDLNGTEHFTEGVQAGTATGVEGQQRIPATYALDQNYPNPFNPSTVISYAVPREGFVTLNVFTVLGQLVKTLVSEHQAAGYYQVKFDATDLPSGMYFYRITSGDFVTAKKLILLR
jgi:hypothetical protein